MEPLPFDVYYNKGEVAVHNVHFNYKVANQLLKLFHPPSVFHTLELNIFSGSRASEDVLAELFNKGTSTLRCLHTKSPLALGMCISAIKNHPNPLSLDQLTIFRVGIVNPSNPWNKSFITAFQPKRLKFVGLDYRLPETAEYSIMSPNAPPHIKFVSHQNEFTDFCLKDLRSSRFDPSTHYTIGFKYTRVTSTICNHLRDILSSSEIQHLTLVLKSVTLVNSEFLRLVDFIQHFERKISVKIVIQGYDVSDQHAGFTLIETVTQNFPELDLWNATLGGQFAVHIAQLMTRNRNIKYARFHAVSNATIDSTLVDEYPLMEELRICSTYHGFITDSFTAPSLKILESNRARIAKLPVLPALQFLYLKNFSRITTDFANIRYAVNLGYIEIETQEFTSESLDSLITHLPVENLHTLIFKIDVQIPFDRAIRLYTSWLPCRNLINFTVIRWSYDTVEQENKIIELFMQIASNNQYLEKFSISPAGHDERIQTALSQLPYLKEYNGAQFEERTSVLRKATERNTVNDHVKHRSMLEYCLDSLTDFPIILRHRPQSYIFQ